MAWQSGIIFDPKRKEMGFPPLTGMVNVPFSKEFLTAACVSGCPSRGNMPTWATLEAWKNSGIDQLFSCKHLNRKSFTEMTVQQVLFVDPVDNSRNGKKIPCLSVRVTFFQSMIDCFRCNLSVILNLKGSTLQSVALPPRLTSIGIAYFWLNRDCRI